MLKCYFTNTNPKNPKVAHQIEVMIAFKSTATRYRTILFRGQCYVPEYCN